MMRKKQSYVEPLDSDEFDVDEPEEIANANASDDDDWTPAAEETGRRQSSRLKTVASKAPVVSDPSSSEDESDHAFGSPRKKGRGRPPAKKAKPASPVKITAPPVSSPSKIAVVSAAKLSGLPDADSTTADTESPQIRVNSVNDINNMSNLTPTYAKEYTSGAFVVAKTAMANGGNPPIWKIDGKALLQKYVPFEQDGKILYKNTSVYSGWTISQRDQFYPATVVFKQQNRKDHIVEFQKELITEDSDSD